MPPKQFFTRRGGFPAQADVGHINTPSNPFAGDNSGWRETRKFGPGFNSNQQVDEQNFARLRESVKRNGIADVAGYLHLLDAFNLPAQLVQAGFPGQITAAGTPILLIPKTTVRQALQIGNGSDTANIRFSFDSPVQAGTTAGGVAQFYGMPIASASTYQESNGRISINDIWVWCNDTSATYPIFVLGYEGTLSLAGNPP